MWVTIVLISDNFCAFTAMNLMWKHLKEGKSHLPTQRYYRVILLLTTSTVIGLLGLTAFTAGKLGQNLEPVERFFLEVIGSTMSVFHVALYPFLYTGIRDLKFRDRIKERIKEAKINQNAGQEVTLSPVHFRKTEVVPSNSLEQQVVTVDEAQ